jgi:hypothetical protein
MSTLTEKGAPGSTPRSPGQSEPPAAKEPIENADLRAEVASLLEITKDRIKKDNLTPCPACNVLVHVKLNKCPHCDSYIAPNNALMRESLRRLGEIRARLDGEHRDLRERKARQAAKSSIGERFRRLFLSNREDEAAAHGAPDPTGPRLLDRTFEGGQLKVLECHGPWYRVSTRDGKIGWVFSTLMNDK